MQESGAADRADFAVAEKAAQRHRRPNFVVKHFGIVVGFAVEILAAPQAGKEQGAVSRVLPVLNGVAFQHSGQVIGRGFGIAQMELHQLPLFQHFADGQDAAALIHSHHIADEEIALLRAVNQGVHYHAEKEGMLHQVAVALAGALVDAAEDINGGMLVQLYQKVAVAAGNPHRLSDGTAALRDHRFHDDIAGEGHAHCAGVVVVGGEEQAVLPRALAGAGQPADFGGGGIGVVHSQQEFLRRKGHRVGQQDELRLVGGIDAEGVVPVVGRGVQAGQVAGLQADGPDADAGQSGGSKGYGRFLLNLGAAADDAAAGAAQQQSLPPQQLAHQVGQVGIVVGVL